jgi:prepilin-type processing-associated H-X9-DG protein
LRVLVDVTTDAGVIKPPRKRILKTVIWSAVIIIGLPLLLLGVLAPSLCRSSETANRVKCASNERQVGQALALFAAANNGRFPDTLEEALIAQDITPEVFCCPSSNDEKAPGATAQEQAANLSKRGHNSYTYLGKGLTTQSPAQTPLLYEILSNHDNDGANVLFVDGSVEWFNKKGLPTVLSSATSKPTD